MHKLVLKSIFACKNMDGRRYLAFCRITWLRVVLAGIVEKQEPFALIEEKTLLFINCVKDTKVFLRVWERSG